jgi:hypothetical protein
MAVFFPLSWMAAKTGKDRYRKPLDAMVKLFSAAPWDALRPPATREGRGADSAASLLAARLFVEMRKLGYLPLESEGGSPRSAGHKPGNAALLFSSLLIPWIRLHGIRESSGGEEVRFSLPDVTGGISDSFFRLGIYCAGYETANLLLELEEFAGEPWQKSLLRSLARICLGCARRFPLGTSFLPPLPIRRGTPRISPDVKRGKKGATGALGPVDSRRLSREVDGALRLAARETAAGSES